MRVLLVDDEKDLLEQAKIFLENNDSDFDVETVISPDEALNKIKKDSFDAVVSDYQMPNIDGLEFLKIIREDLGLDIPFIMFTGKGREDVAMEALNLGADRYIQKGGAPKSQYGVLTEAIIQEVKHYLTKKNLENRKKQFERAVQHAPYPSMLQVEDGEVLLVNKTWTEITGYGEDEIDHISDWTEKAYGEKKDLVESEIETLFEKEKRVNEGVYTVTTKSGEERKWDFSTSPLGRLPDGRRLILSMANDITERKRDEERLKRSQKVANVGSWEIDQDSGELIWSEETYRIYEIQIGKQMDYDKLLEYIHPDDRDYVDEKWNEALETGKYDIEHRIIVDSGLKWVREKSEIKFSDGEPVEAIGSTQDITEQKKAEEDLKESERFLDSILESVQDGISVLDAELNIQFVNDTMKEWYSENTPLEGKKCYRCYHNKNRPCDPCPTLRCLESGNTEKDIVPGLSGSKVEWVELFSYPIKDPNSDEIKGVVEFVRDITERKKKERELEEERNFLEQIAEMSPVCITKLNSDGEIIYANDRAEDILGLSKNEIKGRTYNDVEWSITDYDGDDFPAEKLPFNQVKEKGEPVYGIKHAIEWPNGESKLLSINASPIYDDGEFDGMVASIENVTEKEKKERELKESRRRLKTLMDNIPGMAYRRLNNRNWTMKFISEGCFGLTGYKPEELIDDEVISYKDIIHPDDREYVWDKIQNSVKEGEPFKLEYRIKTKEGDVKWVWEKGRKIDTDGEEFLEGIITDITDRKEIEKELKKSEEKYKSLFYETPLGTFHYDKNGVITDCNQKFVDIIGSSKDVLIGFDMINRLEDDELLNEIRSSLETGEGHYEGDYESLTADKTTPGRILLKGMQDENGKIYAGIGLVEDITEQKEKEEEIEKEKERYESLFEENPEAIVEVDEDFNIIKVNSQFEDLFKYEEDEILGKDLDDLVVPRDKKDEGKILNKRSRKKGYFDHETVRIDKYDNEVDVAITGRPIEHEGKTHHLAVYRDISERREAQKKENFLHSLLRHDVRNKTQLAKGYLELLEESCENEIQEEYLNKASKSILEAEDIINKVSKMKKIKKEEDVKEINLGTALDKVVTELKGQMEENGIKADVEKSTCEVEGGMLLDELFYNIIENSIKHSRCSNIKIKTHQKKDECIVSIEDDGRGIPNRYKDKIFEKGFKRGETAGSGLGIYMVKEIAENYGGNIDVKDSKLGGARFDVHLNKSSK